MTYITNKKEGLSIINMTFRAHTICVKREMRYERLHRNIRNSRGYVLFVNSGKFNYSSQYSICDMSC